MAPPEPSTHRASHPPDEKARAKKHHWRRWFSVATIALAVVAWFGSNWAAGRIARRIRTEVNRQTGLDVSFEHVGFSWRHFTIRAEGVELRHPTRGLLAHADVVDVRPLVSALMRRQVKLASVSVDGGAVILRFEHGMLVNGPTIHNDGPRRNPDLPFRDLAVSDVHVRVEHDQLGTIDLPSIDVDAHNGDDRHILLGVLAQGGSISGARCYNGAIQHLEARAELTDWRTLTVALAHIEAGGVSLNVREAIVPLDLRGVLRADAEVSGTIPTLMCPLPTTPSQPRVHGVVSVGVNAAYDTNTGHLDASGEVHGSNLSLEMPWLYETGRFGLGDRVDVRFSANEHLVTVDSLRVEHSGGTVISPGTQPTHPIRVHLDDLAHPTLEGHVDVAGVQLHRLVHELSVTEFAKVMWNVSAGADVHGELWRFAGPADALHPALWFDVAADTRDFRVLREFYMRQPQFAVISLAHGTVTGQITIDSAHVRFKHLVGLFGPNNRSRVDVGLIQLRMQHSETEPDLVVDDAHGEHVNLADIGHVAEFPISGDGSFTAHGGGLFRDPIVTGEGHLRDFHYDGFPLGDYDTPRTAEWHFRNQRVDFREVEGRAGRSTFVARNAYLDFNRYTIEAGMHLSSDNFYLRDYYHMFKFENDPTFEQYGGQTMPHCPAPGSPAARARSRNDVPCVDPGDPYERDARRVDVPHGTETGHVEVDTSFVLGRPGDDPNGVMEVDFTGRNLYVTGFDEPLSNVDTHYHFAWLQRLRGYRGSRQSLYFARGRYAGGTVESSGNVDLGGQMHFVANVRNAAIAETAIARGQGAAGTLNLSGSLEGWPEAQRWEMDGDVHGLVYAQRNLGDVAFRVRDRPEVARLVEQGARPPRNIWSLDASALASTLHVAGDMVVAWRASSWRDVDGISHPGFDRDWMHAITTGSVQLTHPLDLTPLIPPHMLVGLGNGIHATVEGRIDLDRVQLADLSHSDARITLDQLDIGAQGMQLALASGVTAAACVHDGWYWIEPQAALSATPCEHVPTRLMHRASPNFAESPLPVADFVGPEGTHISLSGGGATSGRLDLLVDGRLDLARFATLVPGIAWARGNGVFQVQVAGNLTNPQLSGTFELHGGALGANVLPDPVEAIDLRVRLAGNDIVFEQAGAQFGASSIDLSGGTAHLQGHDIDRVEIPLRVQNLSLVPQQGVEVALETRNAELSWTPHDPLPRVSGDITFTRVRYTRPINLSQDQNGETQLSTGGSGSSTYDPASNHVQLDLTVHSREPIRVENNIVDGEIVIAENERPFRVTGTDQRVGVVGTLLIPRGRVVLPIGRGSDFEISRGRIEFNNPDRIEPTFDVVAQADVRRTQDVSRNQQWRVNLHAYGTPERFALDMTSDPAASREDIALLLTFAATRAELEQAGAGNLGQAVAVQAIAAATGIDRTVQRAIPVIDDFHIGSAYSPSQGRTVPQVAIGRRINDRVRVGATVNTTDQREMRATVDVRVTQHASVQLGWDNINAQASTQIGNLGADLRWRLEFE